MTPVMNYRGIDFVFEVPSSELMGPGEVRHG